jgi:hypothetical protein
LSALLSVEEIKRWLRANRPGQAVCGTDMPTGAFCRAIGMFRENLDEIQKGIRRIPPAKQRLISRVILEYEAGRIYFAKLPGGGGRRATLDDRRSPRGRTEDHADPETDGAGTAPACLD